MALVDKLTALDHHQAHCGLLKMGKGTTRTVTLSNLLPMAFMRSYNGTYMQKLYDLS